MDYKAIYQAKRDFEYYQHQLARTFKAFTFTEEKMHASGVEVVAKATVKAYYDLSRECIMYSKAIVSNCSPYESLTNGWLTLHEQRTEIKKGMHLDKFIALPDWNDGMEKLECSILKETTLW